MHQFKEFITKKITELRPRLMDTSRRNALINNSLTARSASFIRIVDEKPQNIFNDLVINRNSLKLSPLPNLETEPPDEKNLEFTEAFAVAIETDEHYLEIIDEIDTDNDDLAFEKQAIAERELKDRIRELLGYSPRITNGVSSNLANHARNHGINPSFSLPEPEFVAEDERHEDDQLQTLLLPKALEARLGRIKSRSNTISEEKGIKTLYLSLGFLRWKDPLSSDSKNSYKSPLVILPIDLEPKRTSKGTEYNVKLREEPLLNPVLIHKLDTELGIKLIEPENLSASFDIEEYFKKITRIKSSKLEWRIDREVVLGVYPFQGMELYNDLDSENIDFSSFDVLCHLLSGTDSNGNEPKISSYTEDDIESEEVECLVPKIVLDADSSQYLSLVKAASGQNIAIEGPPGSGKSQTIVNLIANSINSGKKVLFVAQKGTALDVVLSRLTSLNLNSLVLPLMGRKSDKVEFYDALNSRIELSKPKNSVKFDYSKSRELYISQREKLSCYVKCLEKTVYPTKITVHQVLGLAIQNETDILSLYGRIYPQFINLDLLDITDINSIHELSEQASIWQQQLEVNSVKEDSFWSLLDPSKKDYKGLDNIFSLSERIKVEEDELPEDMAFDDYLFPPENDLINTTKIALDYLSSKQIDASVISSMSIETVEILANLKSELEYQTRLSKEHNQSWNNIVKLYSHKDEIGSLVKINELLKIQNIGKSDLYDAVKKEKEILKAHQKVLAGHYHIKAKFGFLLSKQDTKLLTVLSKNHKLFRDNNFVSLINKKGFDALAEVVKTANSLLTRFNETIETLENLNSEDNYDINKIRANLPSTKILLNISNILSNSKILSIFSSEYRRAKSSVKEAFGITKFHKLSILNVIDELIKFSTEWDSEGLFDILGDFRSSKVDKKIKDLDQDSQKIISDIEKVKPNLNYRNTLLSERISIHLLNYLDEFKESFDLIDDDIEWRGIEDLINIKSSKMDYIEENLKAASNSIPAILDAKLMDVSALQKLNEDFELVGYTLDSWGKNLGEFQSQTPKLADIQISDLKDIESINTVRDLITKFSPKVQHTTEDFIKALNTLNNFRDRIDTLYGSIEAYGLNYYLPDNYTEFSKYLKNTFEDKDGPNKIIQISIVNEEINQKGLTELLEYRQQDDSSLDIRQYITTTIIKHLSNMVYDKYGEILSEFAGNRIEVLKEKFKLYDRSLIEIAQKEILNNSLISSKPPQGTCSGPKSAWTEMSLIEHQLGLKRRISPSKIMKRSIQAMMELHPCWMMVPTSVASFLPRKELFDLVIIDEASQMTPENSISALMRGRQAVIVGDTNQLPPSNFFKSTYIRNDSDEDDEDVETIEESILELANSSFRPKHRLLWHYRSRHEALIAFSNHYIYDNELVIFPSPGGSREKMGVDLVRADGVYSRGLNPNEASCVVDEIVEFMETDINRSLGVVTMNQSQMELIEASVIRQSQSNSKVRAYIEKWDSEDEGLQKFFVKNIENVQGDERDVIFISTVYGKDSLGKFRQSFGPINGAAGRRRLNVLFSRAKEKIRTFTSIPIDMLNPREHNEGAILLKRWLEYSATGTLGESLNLSSRAELGPDSPFEEHVIECIESIGYIACPQVGVSNYFIDIGVRHPDYDLGYLCGVECDGASYHSSKSARDRDILRQEVLERLGWDIYRIWSTDWFRDSRGQIERLKEYLDKKLKEKLKDAPIREEGDDNQPKEKEISEDIGTEDITSPIEIKETVRLGSKVCLEYFDGPRAGLRSKFILVDNLNHTSAHEGFDLLPITSPLGEQVNGEEEGSIVSFEAGGKTIDVEIIEILS